MPHARPTEVTIGPCRWTISRIPPSAALPLFGRLKQFVAPAAAKLLENPDAEVEPLAAIRALLETRLDTPEFPALVRDLLGYAVGNDGQRVWNGRDAYDDEVGIGPFTPPDGLQTLALVLWEIIKANFMLPFFSRLSAKDLRGARPAASPASAARRPSKPSSGGGSSPT